MPRNITINSFITSAVYYIVCTSSQRQINKLKNFVEKLLEFISLKNVMICNEKRFQPPGILILILLARNMRSNQNLKMHA